MAWKDTLKGGRADRLTPSMFDQQELERGRRHELEHTRSKHMATEIAMDHLAEDPQYYVKLAKMEGNPSITRRQQHFMCADYGRKKRGQRTRTGMSKRQLREYCMTLKNPPAVLRRAKTRQLIWQVMDQYGISLAAAVNVVLQQLARDPEWQLLTKNLTEGVAHMRGKNPASSIRVEPRLRDSDMKALKSYIRGLRKARPSYFQDGMQFEYRGSTVTIIGRGKKYAKNPHLTSGKWRFVGMFDKRDVKQVKRILRVHGMKTKFTGDQLKKRSGCKELYVERGAFDTAYRAISQLFVSEKSMRAA